MKQIAWKTGTSYGERDAWAIGVTPRYVAGV
jgi:penicillin-binding protein 1C